MCQIFDWLSNLSASDWAAWAQAIGTFVAIFFAARIATKQSDRQFKSSLSLQRIQDAEEKLMLTEAVLGIFKNVVVRVEYVKRELPSRQEVDAVAHKRKYYDLDVLTDIWNTLRQIPVHDLHSQELVTLVLASISTVRQLDIQVDKALREADQMDANDYDRVFKTIDEILASLTKSRDDVQRIFDAESKRMSQNDQHN